MDTQAHFGTGPNTNLLLVCTYNHRGQATGDYRRSLNS